MLSLLHYCNSFRLTCIMLFLNSLMNVTGGSDLAPNTMY